MTKAVMSFVTEAIGSGMSAFLTTSSSPVSWSITYATELPSASGSSVLRRPASVACEGAAPVRRRSDVRFTLRFVFFAEVFFADVFLAVAFLAAVFAEAFFALAVFAEF